MADFRVNESGGWKSDGFENAFIDSVVAWEAIESGLILTSNQIQIKHDSENDALLLGTGYMFMYNNDGARRTYLGYNSDTYDGMFNLYDKRGEVIFNK